jgi:hypothetical protein
MKSAGSGTRTLTAVTGDCATSAHQEGYLLAEKVAALRAEVESVCTSDVLLHQVCDIFCIVTNSCYMYVLYAGTLLSLQLQCMQVLCCHFSYTVCRYFAVTSLTVYAGTLLSLKLQCMQVLCCHFSYSVRRYFVVTSVTVYAGTLLSLQLQCMQVLCCHFSCSECRYFAVNSVTLNFTHLLLNF